MKNAGKVGLVLLDDHALFRQALARLLKVESDFALIAECGCIDDAREVLARGGVNVLLLDLDLGAGDGAEVIKDALHHKCKVMVVTGGVDTHRVRDLIAMGVSGIFLKHNDPALLCDVIRKVADGWSWFEPRLVQDALRENTNDADHPQFGNREKAVLRFVLEGLQNKEIAVRLQLTESTVKSVLQQLFDKTGVRSRSQLVRLALEKYRQELDLPPGR